MNRIARTLLGRRDRGLPVYDLSAANPLGVLPSYPSEPLIETARSYLAERCHEPDPQGSPDARRALCDWYRRRYGLACSAEQLVITASTSESYQLLIQTLCLPGSSILVPSPSYPLIEEFAIQRGVRPRGVPLRRHHGWRYSPHSYEGVLDRSVAAIVLVSPNNPTGTVIAPDELAELIRLLAVLPERPVLIIDEVFAESMFGDHRTCHHLAIESDYPTILLNGLSKSFCAPDLKVGWMVGNDAAWERCGAALVYANDLLLSCSGLNQALMTTMLTEGDGYHGLVAKALTARLEATSKLMRSYSWLHPFSPQGGWMVFAELLRDGIEEEDFFERAAFEGVAIHPGYFYGVATPGMFASFSLLVEGEVLRKGLEVLDGIA